jgi:hypothetical protein
LICHSSYRDVVGFLRDLLGVAISVGTVHHVLQSVPSASAPPSMSDIESEGMRGLMLPVEC